MDNTEINLEKKESSAVWASNRDTCSEALCGAAELNPVEQGAGETPLTGEEHLSIRGQTSENLEGLTEKVGTLGLQITWKNHCGAAKKQARRARLTEVAIGDSSGGQPQPTPADRPQTLQKTGTSGA
jgi:hypothetical protein